MDGAVLPRHAGDRPGTLHTRPAYEAIATKFFEHFLAISHAINGFQGEIGMWDPVDDSITTWSGSRAGRREHLKVRSFVGLIPLFAALTIEPGRSNAAPLPTADGVVPAVPPDPRRQPLA